MAAEASHPAQRPVDCSAIDSQTRQHQGPGTSRQQRQAACCVRAGEQISARVSNSDGPEECDTGCRRAGSGATFASRQGAVPKRAAGSLRWCGETERLGAQERCREMQRDADRHSPPREERVAPTHLGKPARCTLAVRTLSLFLPAAGWPSATSASLLVCSSARLPLPVPAMGSTGVECCCSRP